MTPLELRRLVAKAARRLVDQGVLPDEALGGPPAGSMFRPADPRRTGMPADWSSPIAIRWADTLGVDVRDLAVELAQALSERRKIASVEVSPNGMLTITVSDAARSDIIQSILHDAAGYGLPPGHEPASATPHRLDTAPEASAAADPDSSASGGLRKRAEGLRLARLRRHEHKERHDDDPTVAEREAAGAERGVGGIGVEAAGENDPSLTLDPPVNPTPDDPVGPIQLAHARLRRLIRNAEAAGVQMRKKDRHDELVHPTERVLLVALADNPRRMSKHVVDRDGQLRALTDLANLADQWTQPTRPATVFEHPTRLHGSRLALAKATSIVLRNGLAQVGAIAPERM